MFKKVIFLDVDGVLNCSNDFEMLRSGNAEEHFIVGHHVGERLNRAMVKRLKDIVEKTDASIVLSSTYRKFKDTRDFIRWKGQIVFFDCTPVLTGSNGGNYVQRGTEIDAWLKKNHEVEQFVILDDDGDMLDYQKPFFVQTSWESGMLDDHAEVAIDILNSDKFTWNYVKSKMSWR